MLIRIIAVCAVLTLAASAGAAGTTLGVQGVLTNAAGAVTDGTYTLAFSLYASEDASEVLWTEPIAAEVAGGVFNVVLGETVALSLAIFAVEEAIWLGVSVENEPELLRRPLRPVAYAYVAEWAQTAEVAKALACSGCVGAAALDFDPATQSELEAAVAAIVTPTSVDQMTGGAILGDLAVDGDLDLGLHQLTSFRVHNAAEAPFECDLAAVGAIYFDTTLLRFMGCASGAWLPLSAGAIGSSAENPGLSCKDIRDKGGATTDGVYWIDPDGPPHGDAFEVWCLMTTEGGGWTLVAYNWDKNRTFLTGSYHTVAGPLVPEQGAEAAILPSAVGLEYSEIGFFIDDPQWTSAQRSYTGFWIGNHGASTYDLTSNACQLLLPTAPSQWAGQLVYFGGDGANDNGCTGGGSSFGAGGHTCDDGGGGVTTDNSWPAVGDDTVWGHNCISSFSPTGAYKKSPIPNLGLHAYYVR